MRTEEKKDMSREFYQLLDGLKHSDAETIKRYLHQQTEEMREYVIEGVQKSFLELLPEDIKMGEAPGDYARDEVTVKLPREVLDKFRKNR